MAARVGLEQFKIQVPLDFEVGYRRIFETEGKPGTTDGGGNRFLLRANYRPTKSSAIGVEGSRLFMPEFSESTPSGPVQILPGAGYWQTRAFGSLKAYGFTGTLDFQGYWFDSPVNAINQSIIGSATLGYDVGGGFAVVGAVQGGSTPYYSSYLNGLVKLTYNATYRFREVYE